MVHAPGVAGGDHFPYGAVIPWACEAGCNLYAARGEFGAGVAENGESALRKDVELHQADIFHGVHIKMRGRPAFVALEGGSEVVDQAPREDESAGMHLGMARQTL